MRKYLRILSIIISFAILISCNYILLPSSEKQKRDYGLLLSAVTRASDPVIGEYGDEIPDDLTVENFMLLAKNNLPLDYYEALEKYRLLIDPRKTYYLLIVKDPDDNSIILFDYSCTTGVDGPILNEPNKYDINNLELYNKCEMSE